MIATLMRTMHEPVYAARLRALADAIVPFLRANDRVLDVGCGNGRLGAAVRDHEAAPAGLAVEGLERAPRGDEAVAVTAYAGGPMPFDNKAFDVVTVADVLHHEADDDGLLRECGRVARRLVIVKDHLLGGPLAQSRISLIDWAANAPHGVACLYRYYTVTQWRAKLAAVGLEIEHERLGMRLYPPVVETLFGGRLHYFAAARPACGETAAEGETAVDRVPAAAGDPTA